MPPKKSQAALTNDELLSQFDDLGIDEPPPTPKPSKATSTPKAPSPDKKPESDPLAELDDLVKQRPTSRPSTPRLQSSTATRPAPSPKRTSTATPPSGRASEDKGVGTRKSGDSTRSLHTGVTPGSTNISVEDVVKEEKPAQGSGGGGWWGGIFATASAAVKTAEAAYKEIQKNEEAQKWAEQVKGNVGALRGLGKSTPSTTPFPTILTSNPRIRPPFPSAPNFHLSHPHSRPSNLQPRTPPNPHYPRPNRLSLPGPPNPRRLQPHNVPSRRRRSPRNPTGSRILPAPWLVDRPNPLKHLWLERWPLVAT
jgi:hypothetical protein